ncbi:helix-turn-helix transcriptional regulator [Glycomyces sp. NPDC046736]|uniref:helix-turn-helix transcriptional regulator n=1 Tax=Glycomyces sp. NPDC046736 TaxID=3155615 RepID=UPI0033EF200A
MTLQGFGLSASDEQVWRCFLRAPGTTADAAGHELGHDVTANVERLAAQGILHVDAEGRCQPVDPGLALDRLMSRRLAEVGAELREIAVAGTVLPGLLAEQRGPAPVGLVERIDGAEATQRRVLEVSAAAREVLAMHGPEEFKDRPELTEHTLTRLRSDTVYRTLVHRSILDSAPYAARARRLHEAGDRHRVSGVELRDMLIYDRAVAFVRIDPADSSAGAFMISQPGIVAGLVDHFELAWSTAADLVSGPDGPSAVEREVLELLTRHGKDEAAARAMGVSVRTFRRHVADLMARLGAANRFHLGSLAVRRGWV